MKMFARKIAVLIALVVLIFGPASCMKRGPAGKRSNVDYYTCTMHPSVKSQDPNGKCPICSMDLVPVMKKGGSDEKASAPSPKPEGMKGMSGMQGMPGMKGGVETNAPQTSEFVVPVE